MKNKKYDGLSNQNAVIKTTAKTLSTYPNLEFKDNNSYEFLEKPRCYVTVKIHEKDKGLTVHYNIGMDTAYILMEQSRFRMIFSETPYKWEEIKIQGAFPKPRAVYEEACRTAGIPCRAASNDRCCICRKVQIQYAPKRPDGQVSRRPWTISIKNGMSVANDGQNGSFSERGGTFAMTGQNQFTFTNEEFYTLMREQTEFFDDIKARVKSGEFPQVAGIASRIRAYEEYRTQSDYRDGDESQASAPAGQEAATEAQITVLQEFQKNQKSGTYFAKAKTQEHGEITVNVEQVTPGLTESLAKKTPVNVLLWKKGTWWYAQENAQPRQQALPQASPAGQQPKPPTKVFTVSVETETSDNEFGGLVANCRHNGKNIAVHFRKEEKELLSKSYITKVPVQVQLCKDAQGRIHGKLVTNQVGQMKTA